MVGRRTTQHQQQAANVRYCLLALFLAIGGLCAVVAAPDRAAVAVANAMGLVIVSPAILTIASIPFVVFHLVRLVARHASRQRDAAPDRQRGQLRLKTLFVVTAIVCVIAAFPRQAAYAVVVALLIVVILAMITGPVLALRVLQRNREG